MTRLSGCTVIRNGILLGYPFEASLRSYLPICDEVVISYDPSSNDKTEESLKSLAQKYSNIRIIPSVWDLKNKQGGSEICIQSNIAIEECRGDWVLYVQADEALHENDHDAIRSAIARQNLVAGLFNRRSFHGTLKREIPAHRASGLLRLFRNGVGISVGDAMSCRLFQGVQGEVLNAHWRLFNYSRMGNEQAIIQRSRNLHSFYHTSEAAIEEILDDEGELESVAFAQTDHPYPIQEYYSPSDSTLKAQMPPAPAAKSSIPVTLAVLLGKMEQKNIIPFLWTFREWQGRIALLADGQNNPCSAIFLKAAKEILQMPEDRISIAWGNIGDDFAAARNALQDLSETAWVLHADLDERWPPSLFGQLGAMVTNFEMNGTCACGFSRANFLGTVLVNDIPDRYWTEIGLQKFSEHGMWPPKNQDVQFRLLRQTERWVGRIHEKPQCLLEQPDKVAVLSDCWVLHAKDLERQREQDAHYRSLGQIQGMPLH